MKIKEINKIEEGLYEVSSDPCYCGEVAVVQISGEKLFAYHQGAMVQEVLEGYSADVRESFVSGMCPKHFKQFCASIGSSSQ